ncbi:MAG: hypothetical protein LWW77_05915 [Propionibacteriales bacterium]|nr:hypothetical protein [Propionibacteriales bacterium]
MLGSAVAAIFAGFGGSWMLPTGLVLAVAGGVLASYFAWREVKVTRTTLQAQLRDDARRASELMQDATRRHLGVVKLLSARNGELVHQLNQVRSEAATVSLEAAQLRGDKVALQFELNQRLKELAVVREGLNAVQDALDDQVVPLPVRELMETAAQDLWTEDGFPTVVQIERLINPPIAEVEQRKHA